MEGPLSWRFVGKHDKSALQAFTCASPAKPQYRPQAGGLYHPRPWEIKVQSWIRTHVVAESEYMLVGLDDAHKISGVFAWQELDSPAEVFIQALAVDVQYRRQGGVTAKETLGIGLDHIEDSARRADCSQVTIAARIHRPNLPSQQLFAWGGFTKVIPGDELDEWVLLRQL